MKHGYLQAENLDSNQKDISTLAFPPFLLNTFEKNVYGRASWTSCGRASWTLNPGKYCYGFLQEEAENGESICLFIVFRWPF